MRHICANLSGNIFPTYDTRHYGRDGRRLEIGDQVEFMSAGAYTSTYASIGFNGYPPLDEYYI